MLEHGGEGWRGWHADEAATHLPRLMTPRGMPVGVLKAGKSLSPSSNTFLLKTCKGDRSRAFVLRSWRLDARGLPGNGAGPGTALDHPRYPLSPTINRLITTRAADCQRGLGGIKICLSDAICSGTIKQAELLRALHLEVGLMLPPPPQGQAALKGRNGSSLLQVTLPTLCKEQPSLIPVSMLH